MRAALRSFFLVLLMAGAVAPFSVVAQEQTADEALTTAFAAYNAGRYDEAAAGFEKFIADFGESTQGREAIVRIRHPLAMSLLQLRKFDAALGAIEEALTVTPPLPPDQRQTLLFYLGVCQMQADVPGEARATFEKFLREFPNAAQAQEALLLAGTTWLLQGEPIDAAKHFATIRDRLNPVNRGRAVVLELHALIEAEDTTAALALVVAEYPRMDEMLQIATFQTLALGLGSAFLEADEPRKAIQCLQRVWERDRLLKHQEKRLADLSDALAAVEAQPRSDPYQKFQLQQMIAKVRRELGNLKKIESFDAALRLRLASAFQSMGRNREAALILEAILREMPKDAVVEAASVNLVQCWSALERWPRAVETAQTFAQKFPDSAQLPLVRYLEGISLQREGAFDEAVAVFAAISKDSPDSDFAPRALFMEGFTQLLAERNPLAIAAFESFATTYPKHELADAAAYWRGMAFSFDGQHGETREVMDAYLADFPEGTYRGLAVFRRAYAAQAAKDYATSVPELEAYLADYPGHESNAEALLLLGDARMSEGEIERGIEAFLRIPPENTRFFEEGWFKTGKAYRLLEQPDDLRAHFERFVAERPDSPRVAEAIYWIGWTHRQAGEPEKARDGYWAAIDKLGNDPGKRAVEDLFPALAKLYSGPEEQAQYRARLRDLRERAKSENAETLLVRAYWAEARAEAKADPERARTLMTAAAARADVSTTNPMLLADFADALTGVGESERAEQMWRDLVKWNPRAPQRDRAFAALGRIERERGNEQAALAWFARFERETPASTGLGDVLLAKAELLDARGTSEEARAALERLLASEAATGQQKAEALYRIGDSHLRAGRADLAVPYFQRIYIMHGRWQEWVARAYLRSGEAFEELNNPDAARKTYSELAALEALADFPESARAKERLQALGGGEEL